MSKILNKSLCIKRLSKVQIANPLKLKTPLSSLSNLPAAGATRYGAPRYASTQNALLFLCVYTVGISIKILYEMYILD